MTRVTYQLELVILNVITITILMLHVSCDPFPALKIKKYPLSFEDFELHAPPLSQLAKALLNGLKNNYAEVSVQEVDCPDLTKAPFNLASKGLCGSTAYVEVGGMDYLIPVPKTKRVYDLVDIGQNVLPNAKSFSVYGAGSGPFMTKTQYCEGVYNLKVDGNKAIVNECRISHFKRENRSDFNTEKVPADETRMAFLGNMFVTEGKPGMVVHINAKKRIGSEASFVMACRNAVYEAFGWKVVGVGGVFVVKNGTTVHHIGPYTLEKDGNTWKKLLNMPAPLTSIGTFISVDMGLDMQLGHFHSFSHEKWGGHYEYDADANNIEYEAYFNVAQRAVLIDRPNN